MEGNAYLGELSAGIIYLLAGIRLVLLSIRTAEIPERLLGASFILLGVSGILYSLPDIQLFSAFETPIFFAARVAYLPSCMLVALFTARVFRPDARWAKGLVRGVAAMVVVGVGGSAADGDWEGFSLSSVWFWFEWVGQLIPFVWVALAALTEYVSARRRARVGLSNALVSNRYLLFGCFGLVQLATVVLLVPMYIAYETDNGAFADWMDQSMGSLEMLTIAMIWLAFFPLALYRSWVERAAAPRPEAEGAVDVEPGVVTQAKIRNLRHRIDRPHVCRAGGRDNAQGPAAAASIRLHFPRQRSGIHHKLVRRRNDSHLPIGETENAQRALVRVVRLIAQIDNAVAEAVRRLHNSRSRQSREIGHRSPADEQATGRFGESAYFAQPVDDDEFELGRSRAANPGSDERIEPADECVGHRTDKVARAGYKSKEPGVSKVHAIRKDIRRHPVEDFVERTPLFRCRLFEQRPQCGAVADANRGALCARKRIESFDKRVDDAVADPAHLIGRHAERIGSVALLSRAHQ